MKSRILSLIPLLVYCVAVPVWGQELFNVSLPQGVGIDQGKLFIVNQTGDTADANPGDNICADANGKCTLRAAVDETNANQAFPDTIIFELPYPAVIELTQGSLDLTDPNLRIVGPGARRLTIRRSSSAGIPFRIFHIPNAGNGFNGPIIRGFRLEGGSAGNFIAGGALRIGPGVVVDLLDMWITGNSAGAGGAISNEGTLRITRSLIAGNNANAEGGALHLVAGSNTRITNSTITMNSAATGGAIFAAGTLLSVNNTISHNSATSAASGIASASGSTVNILNTIIGSDTSLPITTLSGTFNSLGNNLVTDARAAMGFTNGVKDDQVSDSNAIDPLLGPLADNGGQTDARSPITGSPAIDRGSSCVSVGETECVGVTPAVRLRWDQRVSYPRRNLGGAVDVGAVESGGSQSSGGFGFGTFSIGVGPRRIGMGILINVATGERRYALTNMRGSFGFSDLGTGNLYVMVWQSKSFQTAPVIVPPEF